MMAGTRLNHLSSGVDVSLPTPTTKARRAESEAAACQPKAVPSLLRPRVKPSPVGSI